MPECAPVAIRPASSHDAAVVAEIYVESSNAAFAPYQPRRVLTDDLLRRWEAALASPAHRWWIAELDGQPAAFAGIGPSRDPVHPAVGELDTIAVRPAVWRRGAGRALMAFAHTALDGHGYERAVLWTWRDYERAYRFYESMGWKLTALTRDNGQQVCFERRRSR